MKYLHCEFDWVNSRADTLMCRNYIGWCVLHYLQNSNWKCISLSVLPYQWWDSLNYLEEKHLRSISKSHSHNWMVIITKYNVYHPIGSSEREERLFALILFSRYYFILNFCQIFRNVNGYILLLSAMFSTN